MRRRDFVILIGGAAVGWPLTSRAQQTTIPVIGWLSSRSPRESASLLEAFVQGLRDTGYVAGQNLTIEYRWAEGKYDRLPALAAELVGRKVDLIATSGGPNSAVAAKNATATIPIVFVTGDPVGDGLVASLARPGGNLTGVSILTVELTSKRLELLSELVPDAKVVALLVNPDLPQTERVLREVPVAASMKGLDLVIVQAATPGQIDTAFDKLVQARIGALLVGADPFFNSRREQLVALASRNAIPAIYFAREFTVSGGLISYGAGVPAANRQIGIYAGRILKGEKPGDLPVQQPDKFELVVNLKTAAALGLSVPQSLLARADEVIE